MVTWKVRPRRIHVTGRNSGASGTRYGTWQRSGAAQVLTQLVAQVQGAADSCPRGRAARLQLVRCFLPQVFDLISFLPRLGLDRCVDVLVVDKHWGFEVASSGSEFWTISTLDWMWLQL
jgi:hypothetical protein